MSEKENTRPTRARAKRFTVIGKYGNATGFKQGDDLISIEHGDVCVVRVGAAYKDGDCVLMECSCNYGDAPHYHARFYQVCYGKKYKFKLNSWSQRGGTHYMEGQESIIIGVIVRVIQKGEKAPRTGKLCERVTYTSGFEWPYFGLHLDDEVTVERNGQAIIGKLALINHPDDPQDEADRSTFWRVCSVQGDTVTVGGSDDETYKRALSLVIGPVVEIKHDYCAPTKIKELQETLEGLKNESESWANTSRCYEVEREIYDLEHPIETEDDEDEDDEWPEVIGEGGAQ